MGEHASRLTGGGVEIYLHVSRCTHGNDVVHISTESWDALVIKCGTKVKIYCIWSEKTSISILSVVGIFIYILSTLPDRRKANPGL